MRICLSVFASIAISLGSAFHADAFNVISQDRSVSASASALDYETKEEDHASESFSAPDLGPFAEGAGATAEVSSALAGGSGTQNSPSPQPKQPLSVQVHEVPRSLIQPPGGR